MNICNLCTGSYQWEQVIGSKPRTELVSPHDLARRRSNFERNAPLPWIITAGHYMQTTLEASLPISLTCVSASTKTLPQLAYNPPSLTPSINPFVSKQNPRREPFRFYVTAVRQSDRRVTEMQTNFIYIIWHFPRPEKTQIHECTRAFQIMKLRTYLLERAGLH